MKKIVVKYQDYQGIMEVVERDGQKVYDEFDQSGDLYFSFEDMFQTEYELLELDYDIKEIENIMLDFQQV